MYKLNVIKNRLTLLLSVILTNFILMSYAVSDARVKISVNNNAITENDISQRVALLRLQHQSGNLVTLAKKQLIEQEIQRSELLSRNVMLDSSEIDNKYQDFAKKNHMNIAQLSMMLVNAGLTPEHFKNYVATQLAWQELVVMRYRAENGNNGMLSQAETMQRVIANGGAKPQVSEYNLQKIIFVLPDHPSAKLIKQAKNKAEYFRKHFTSCEASRLLAANMQDVIIQNIGRILAPQLPSELKQLVERTKVGQITGTITSADGLVAAGICDKRLVSDDRAAQMVYSMNDSKKNSPKLLQSLNDKYLAELKASARIVNF